MSTDTSGLDVIRRHQGIWRARPELRYAYANWFAKLLSSIEDRSPIVELGSGPGFFKEFHPGLIATDILPGPRVDVLCDAGQLSFDSASIGAFVMIDVLHHLPRPLEFMSEAARCLQPGGRVAMIEPWITPTSYILYRYIHHEECFLGVDLNRPFTNLSKHAFDGNAAIPIQLVRRCKRQGTPLRLVRVNTFLGLPYLATLGFKSPWRIPRSLIRAAEVLERLLQPLRSVAATRALLIWERAAGDLASTRPCVV